MGLCFSVPTSTWHGFTSSDCLHCRTSPSLRAQARSALVRSVRFGREETWRLEAHGREEGWQARSVGEPTDGAGRVAIEAGTRCLKSEGFLPSKDTFHNRERFVLGRAAGL